MNECSCIGVVVIDQLQPICVDTDDLTQAEALQAHLLDVERANQLAEIFKALSDPTRLRIVALLLENEVCVHSLELALGMSQSAVSHQLRVLRQLHLVRYRKEGRHVFYALDDDHVRRLFEQGLLHIEHE
jgi:ArsR family transcriptional regulator